MNQLAELAQLPSEVDDDTRAFQPSAGVLFQMSHRR